jgi:hypothetical protein
MTSRRIGMAVFVAGLLTVLGRAPTFTAAAADDKNLEELVQNAKTAADHEAIAKLYDDEAAMARKKAAEHRKMGAEYTHFAAGGTKGQLAHFDMPKHCSSLVKSYENAAKEAEAMAAAHREAAKLAK